MNQVTLVGRLSRPPKKVRDCYTFPLAIYAPGEPRPVAFAPIVAIEPPPEGLAFRYGQRLQEQVQVRVSGYVRTRNRTLALRDDVQRLLVRSGLENGRLVRSLVSLIPEDLKARHVEVEIVAQDIQLEVESHEHPDPAGHVGR